MTPGERGCPQPIDDAVLVDYWLALLADAEQETVEEHLFACDECGDRLRQAIDLAEALRGIARSGLLQVVVDEFFVRHAAASGRRVRQYRAGPGQTVHCTVSVDDDLLFARLAADLSGAARVDLSWCDARGVERKRLSDIPVRGDASGVVLQESMAFIKGLPSATMIARLLAVDAGGAERVLGEYTFEHTRTIPGPARVGVVKDRRLAARDVGVEHCLDVDDRRAVDRLESVDLQPKRLDGRDADLVQAERVRAVRRTRAEDARARPARIAARMIREDAAVGSIEPGDDDDLVARLDAGESIRDGRIEVEPCRRGAFVGLPGRGREVGQCRSDLSDRAQREARRGVLLGHA